MAKTSKNSKSRSARRKAHDRDATGRHSRNSKRTATSRSKQRAQKPLNEIPVSLDHARRLFMVTKRVKGSAESTGVSESQLRRLIRKYKLAKWDPKTRRWRITDRARREVGIISGGSAKAIIVRGFAKAQLAKTYSAAVKRFLETNDAAVLAPFEGQSITDVGKRTYEFETLPNVLLRLANTGGDADMKIYRLID